VSQSRIGPRNRGLSGSFGVSFGLVLGDLRLFGDSGHFGVGRKAVHIGSGSRCFRG